MRVYIYGGDRHDVRKILGSWPTFSSNALSSRDDLATGPSFGVGLRDGKIHLIVRELWTDARDGYPYTLLLSPSPEAWRRFGWNAAAMIQVLLEVSDDHFEHPESLHEQLAEEIEQKAISRAHPSAQNYGESAWMDVCVGSYLMDAPLIVSSRAIGFPEQRGFGAMEAILNTVPPWARIGNGWLIGRNKILGAELGTAIQLDEDSTNPQEFRETLQREGSFFIRSVEKMRTAPGGFETDAPLHEWPGARDLNRAFKEIASNDQKDLVPGLEGIKEHNRPQLERFVEETYRARLRSGQSLGGQQSTFLLNSLQRRVPLPAAERLEPNEVDRLEPGALAAYLQSHDIPPQESTILKLAPRRKLELALEMVAAASSIDAEGFVRLCDFAGGGTSEVYSALYESLRLGIAKKPGLLPELIRSAAAHSALVARRLHTDLDHALEQATDVNRGSDDSLELALCSGRWTKGHRDVLLRSSGPGGRIAEIVGRHIDDSRVRQWLETLAIDEDLRPLMHIQTKVILAEAGIPGWRPISLLREALLGGNAGFSTEPVPPRSQRRMLRDELQQLLTLDAGRVGKSPAVDLIDDWLILSRQNIEAIERSVRKHFVRAKIPGYWRQQVSKLPSYKQEESIRLELSSETSYRMDVEKKAREVLEDDQARRSLGVWLPQADCFLILLFFAMAVDMGVHHQLAESVNDFDEWSNRWRSLVQAEASKSLRDRTSEEVTSGWAATALVSLIRMYQLEALPGSHQAGGGRPPDVVAYAEKPSFDPGTAPKWHAEQKTKMSEAERREKLRETGHLGFIEKGEK